MPVFTDFSRLHAGLTPTEAMDVFFSYCNRRGTLYAPERWFRHWSEILIKYLPPSISEDHVLALVDALLGVSNVYAVCSWLTCGNGMGWVEWNEQRIRDLKIEREAARQEAIRMGFFPWAYVDSCRQRGEPELESMLSDVFRCFGVSLRQPAETLRDRPEPCPVCGAGFDNLVQVYIIDTDLCETAEGTAGWLTICDKCHIQVQFFCEISIKT